MPKPQFAAIRRDPRPYHHFEIEDPKVGKVELDLRRLLDGEDDLAQQQAAEWTRRYVTGGYVHPKLDVWCKDPEEIHIDDQGKLEVGEETMLNFARILKMQAPGSEEEIWTFDDLANLMGKGELAWEALKAFARAVYTGAADRATGKKSSPGPSETPQVS